MTREATLASKVVSNEQSGFERCQDRFEQHAKTHLFQNSVYFKH